MAFLSLTIFVVIFVVISLVERSNRKRQNHYSVDCRPLPGPKGLPIIGSVHELPKKNSWMKFHEWGEKYGPIYQVNLAGTNHVWITLDRIARDLLAGRSSIYSDRPFIPALEQDNRTSGQYLPLMSRNEKWTRQRKFAKQIMDSSEKAAFFGYPELESIRLLFELISDPSHYNTAMESFISRVTCRLAWGSAAPSDELKQRARELLIGVSPTGALGNKLPFIMSLPEKFCKAKAWESRRSRTERKFFETMQKEVQNDMDTTSAPKTLGATESRQSWMRMFLENKARWKFASDLEGCYAVGMHGIAGALTIAAPMQSFCLAICHYPQYQPILHEEIDRVLGDRMPTFADMPDMPVLRAFIRETLRWRPPVPTGIPHELTQDDVYEGYHIPKGSVIHPLEWSISREPETFPDADAWNPLRWLDPKFPTYQAPLSKYPTITGYSQFGYGRRTCQGMGVTEADLFVGLGSVAWLFSIQLKDDEGHATKHASHVSPEAGRDPWGKGDEYTKPHSLKVETVSSLSKSTSMKTHSEVESIESQLRHGMLTPPSTPQRRSSTMPDYFMETHQSKPDTDRLNKSTPAAKPTCPTEAIKSEDPTMDFSSLLIAKPMPFTFDLQVRSRTRAEQIMSKWMQLKMDGDFEDARVYWAGGKSTAGDAKFGWGEVFS